MRNPQRTMGGGTRSLITRARMSRESQAGLEHALQAYRNYAAYPRQPHRLRNSLLVFIDFSQPHTEHRGHLIDTRTNQYVIEPFLVAHGARIAENLSESEKRRLAYGLVGDRVQPITPREFSNAGGSNLSSLGFGVTGELTESSNWRWRIFIDGCSGPAFNSNLRRRLAYFHPYPAVLRDSSGRALAIAASQGCPAVEDHVFEQLRTRIPNGTGIYIYAPVPSITQDPIYTGRMT